jgi:uncharacterized coiled-coil protein SlyX
VSELGDTVKVLEAHDARIDALEVKDAKTNQRIDALIEHVNRFERTVDGLFTILRDGVAEECRLLREGINRGRY